MNNDLFGKPIKEKNTNNKIEVVRLHRLDSGGSIKAFADIQFNNEFIIKGFRVVDGRDGLFIAMPCEINRNGRFINTFEILTDEMKTQIEEAIINAYEA
jgi:stage V sporulation protein G